MIDSIVSQHVEEAGSLWVVRDRNVYASHFMLMDLLRLDQRIEAHLDGIRVAGEPAWKMIDANQGAGAAFVAAYFAYESAHQDSIQKIQAIAAKNPGVGHGMLAALAWHSPTLTAKYFPALLTASEPGLRHVGLGAALSHRLNPGIGLEKALFDSDLGLRAVALRVVGIMGYAVWTNHLRKELRSADLGCRFAAAWSLARISGDTAALGELQTIALAESKYRIPSVNMLVRRLDPGAARKCCLMLERLPGADRLAVFAAGALGDPAAVPALLERMSQTAYARLAGESFSMITGLGLAAENMDGPIPPDHEPIPNEDPLDERVEMDPDENLPWPIVEKVKAWWSKNSSRYREGVRYLVGQPLNEESANAVLATGYQRQRAMAALELSLRHPGQPIFNITMPQR